VTGPEHYREAEALAGSSLNWMGGNWGPEDMTPGERLARKNSDLAKAQVHATLALVATWADFTRTAGVKPKDYGEVTPLCGPT
jgi:hypothetical protein